MGQGYATPVGGGLDIFRHEFAEINRRLRELETPSASQVNGNLATIQANMVLPQTIYRLDSPLVSASITEFAQVSTVVPASYTRALVSITASAGVKSAQDTGWATIVVSAGIGGTAKNTMRNSIPAGLYGSVTTAASAVLMDLTEGDSIDVSAFAAFPEAYTVPSVSVSGSILFLR